MNETTASNQLVASTRELNVNNSLSNSSQINHLGSGVRLTNSSAYPLSKNLKFNLNNFKLTSLFNISNKFDMTDLKLNGTRRSPNLGAIGLAPLYNI